MAEKTTHIVVLGAGYAGLMAAMRLAHKTDSLSVAITIVNANVNFNERVRNHQLISGDRLPDCPLDALFAKTRIRFEHGTVSALDPDRHVVIVGSDSEKPIVVSYDYLVYALGSHVDVGSTPGAREYAYTLDAPSAASLAPLLPDLAARGGRVLIVGAGNTGVEVSTEMAERFPGLRITVVTRRSFAPNLSDGARRHIRKAFSRLGIHLIENTEVTRLARHEAMTAAGPIQFDESIWVGGFAVSDLARCAGILVNERGQILVDRALSSLSHPDIYAAGDAAMPADDPGTPIRMSLYAAGPMGAHAADALAAQLRGRQPSPFGLSYVAQGLSLGRRDGVVQFLDGASDTATRFMITGRIANWFREFFVGFLLLTIRLQRTVPWVFYWPGMNKMRSRASKERSIHEAAHADD